MKINLKHKSGFDFSALNAGGIEIKLSGSTALGGNGIDFRPMELVLIALASCCSFDLVNIFKKRKLVFSDFKVRAEGIRREKAPQFFKDIQLNFSLRSRLKKKDFNRYIDLCLNKYCSVRSMLKEEVAINYDFQILSPS